MVALKNPTHPQRLRKMTDSIHAFQLRRRGLTFGEIARLLDVSESTVARYIHEEMIGLKQQVAAEANDYRLMEISRLDRLFAQWWPRAMKDIEAAKLCLKIVGERAELWGAKTKGTSIGKVVVNQSFEGLPVGELVALAQQRGIPVPLALLRGTDDRALISYEGSQLPGGSHARTGDNHADSQSGASDGLGEDSRVSDALGTSR